MESFECDIINLFPRHPERIPANVRLAIGLKRPRHDDRRIVRNTELGIEENPQSPQPCSIGHVFPTGVAAFMKVHCLISMELDNICSSSWHTAHAGMETSPFDFFQHQPKKSNDMHGLPQVCIPVHVHIAYSCLFVSWWLLLWTERLFCHVGSRFG